jgi:hypothetical protein
MFVPTFSRRHTKHTQTIRDTTQKDTAIDQQQHSLEMLMCHRHQSILRFLSTAATASTRCRVPQTSYVGDIKMGLKETVY